MNWIIPKILQACILILIGSVSFSQDLSSSKLENKTVGFGFTENKGQIYNEAGSSATDVLYVLTTNNLKVYLTKSGLTYSFNKVIHNTSDKSQVGVEQAWFNVHLENASILKENIIYSGESVAEYNFIINTFSEETTGLKQYNKLIIKDVYPGIDWVLFGDNKNSMKFEFHVHPHADPSQIQLKYEGEKPVEKLENGELSIFTKLGNISENKPYVYLKETGAIVQSEFTCTLVDRWNTRVDYELGSYDSDKTLIIDPILEWGTFFSGAGVNGASSLSADNDGNLFLTGYAGSAEFPLLDAGTYYSSTPDGGGNVFISKFSQSGVLLWSTFYGSTEDSEAGFSINIGPDGNVFVSGETFSSDIPLLDAGTYFDGTFNGFRDPFILKFDNDGNYLWGTYFGGNDDFDDYVSEIATDAFGNLFFLGWTDALDRDLMDAGTYFDATKEGVTDLIIAKFSNDGTMLWSTYIGGSQFELSGGLEITSENDVYISGMSSSTDYPTLASTGYFNGTMSPTSDGIITRFDNDGNLVWSTFFGGTSGDLGTIYNSTIHSVISDETNTIFITGSTAETDFPLVDAGTYFNDTYGGGVATGNFGQDFFISKFDVDNTLLWSTYHGGTENESSIDKVLTDNTAIDSCGNFYVLMGTASPDVPVQEPDCNSFYIDTFSGYGDAGTWGAMGGTDMHLSKFSNEGELIWATYLGHDNTMNRSALGIEAYKNDLFVAGHNSLDFLNPDNHAGIPLNNPGGGAYFNDEITVDEKITIFKFVPDTLQVTAVITEASCDCTGAVDLSVCGTPPFTYAWSSGETTEDISEACAGNYTVIITDSSCPVRKDTFHVEIEGPPDGISLTEIHIDPICGVGGEATVTVTGGTPGYTFLWDEAAGSQTTATATGLTAGTYTCTVTDADGCMALITVELVDTAECALYAYGATICEGESAEISASASFGVEPYTYVWSDDVPDGPGPHLVTPAVTTEYTVTVTDADGIVMSEVATVTVLPLPILDLGPDTMMCEGSVLLDAENVGASYTWNDLSTEQTLLVSSTGIYYVEVDNGGCLVSDTIEITIPNISVDLGPDLTLCSNPEFILDAENPGLSYLWQDLSTEQTFSVNASGTYFVTVSDDNGCEASDTVNILVDAPIALFSVSDTVGCAPLVASFTDLSISTSEIISWTWDFGDGSGASTQNPDHTYPESGVYVVDLQVSTIDGCVSDTNRTVTVVIHPQPIAAFDFIPDIPEVGSEVLFEDLSVNALTWDWSFGDGDISEEQNPSHAYEELGTFDVILVVTNFDCVDSAWVSIIIEESLIFYVPNAFTPDGDEHNNVFQPIFTSGFDPYDYHLMIFNRWGELIFESFNTEVGWDGTYGNKLVEDGVYIWKIEFGNVNNDKIHKSQGHVVILK